MTTHNHDVLMAISSRIINGRSSGAKQLNADYRALVKARDEIIKLREKLAAQPAPSQYGSPELQEMVVARALEKDCAAPPASVPLTPEQYFEIGQRHWLPSNIVKQIHAELNKAAAQPAPVQVSIEMVPDPAATVYPELYKATWEAMHGPAPVQEPVAMTFERLSRGMEILAWNRSQANPPIEITKEQWVANELERFYTTPPAQPAKDNTYGYAKSLAESLFKKHYAHKEPYASGSVVWEVSDTTIGVLTQIDNMVCTLVHQKAQPAPVHPVERIESINDTDSAYAYADGWNACVECHKYIAKNAPEKGQP